MQQIKSIAAQALTALQQGGANKGAVSAAVGHKKENMAHIMEKSGAKCVKILEKDCREGDNISIDII